MEALIASAIAVLVACGFYLVLRARTFPVIIGLALFSYAANLYIFSTGRLTSGMPPVLQKGVPLEAYADPLPQALILTAIVIGFAMTAFILVLAISGYVELGTDHLDAKEQSR
ncbi:Na+/H+ antiporter subunit C [Bradymonadaceae bacterium TMQ3]|uniref:Na+/H+ antiporter subunit C n=1 Tax=Lujinxingia sediminis TaxID=2480984 RepID=A0ABY0CRJ2_9DELT|nr:Na+/H+ antiporter subunit C [Lujinxingia sediminis]RDV37789.1 Na+/H+ antiporter subunit C [Bradymonadaceae bacterium TMQ3]RVU43194.1 Na+/H+ antiporter subunit C [Lujinxingia sediminis]TXC75427.1 Na+/H+ antiporter subunit C [Bradymonadales bacterium TMQ1]